MSIDTYTPGLADGDWDLEVRYDKGRGAWVVEPYQGNVDKPFAVYPTKVEAIERAAELGRLTAKKRGSSVELYIRTKAGRIGKGASGRRTYGYDPESSDG